MPEQTVAPATAVDEAGFYSAVGAISTVTELNFRRENNGPSIAFTEMINASAFPTARGWTRLPAGILLQWGPVPITVSGSGYAITFPQSFATTVFGVWVQEITGGGATHNTFQVLTATVSITGATVTSKDGNGNASTSNGIYVALGM